MTTKRSNDTVIWVIVSPIIGALVGSLITMLVLINQGLVG